MNEKPRFLNESKSLVVKSKKAPYRSPELKVFGSVSKLTMGPLTQGTADGGSGSYRSSDPRIKQDIVCIGTHPLGIGLYLFDYKPVFTDAWGHGRQFGVMADEVEKVMPEAVSMHPDGYKMVNYSMLGISRALH